jgi:hypothetical protein
VYFVFEAWVINKGLLGGKLLTLVIIVMIHSVEIEPRRIVSPI